jgi:ankyrin repeat protein
MVSAHSHISAQAGVFCSGKRQAVQVAKADRMREESSDTALHVAAAAHLRELAQSLVARGADARARNRRGAEPLHYAADGSPETGSLRKKAQSEVIISLIEAGALPTPSTGVGSRRCIVRFGIVVPPPSAPFLSTVQIRDR